MSRLSGLLGALVMLVTLGGCHGFVVAPSPGDRVTVRTGGPPPHAPAHGYRHKHGSDCELRFDSHLGVYVVVGAADVYFHDGWFLRVRNGGWQFSAELGGPWQPRSDARIPAGLRTKHHVKKSKKRGRGAAKGAW